jgi:dolichol-phosphate mannosyltransferase
VRVWICLPTYNERENLEPMVRALGDVLDEEARVLVIDDSSPDGTGEAADALAEELELVEVLHRERKEGLGPAYLAGFRRALDAGAELVLEMDCDFSHDPADVPRLIAAVQEGADVALGSRYVAGGGTRNWIDLDRIASKGYAFQIETVYRAVRAGFRVAEIPITFSERERGGSKMSRRIVFEAVWRVPALRLRAVLGRL